jgi:hypothetical protein
VSDAPGDGAPAPRRDEERPPLPDLRPLRRIQVATALLIVAAGVVTLLSDERPGAVRWGTLVGLIVLIVTIYVVTRRRRSHG